jgi:hypothetical protein
MMIQMDNLKKKGGLVTKVAIVYHTQAIIIFAAYYFVF